MDVIITNSKTVEKRLAHFTGYESEVIYPPTDTSRFAPHSLASKNPKNYFLSFARLSPPKRVDLIIDAFVRMPEQNLVLTYGQNDPLREQIIAKVRNYKNITAIESPTDDELISLIEWARATIYIPVEEDFGMSPVESMACGTPVIGANEWGLRETIIDGETGFLIETSVENIEKAVQKMTPELSESFREKCQSRARDFSLEKFVEKLHEVI